MGVAASVELSAHYERLQSSVLNIPDTRPMFNGPHNKARFDALFCTWRKPDAGRLSTITTALGLSALAKEDKWAKGAERWSLETQTVLSLGEVVAYVLPAR